MIVADHHRLVHASRKETVRSHRAAAAVLGLGVREAAVFDVPGRTQDMPLGAF